MDRIGAAINSIPKPIRDFIEGAIAVGITTAVGAVLGLNLSDPSLSARQVAFVAGIAFTGAVIAYARRAITPAPAVDPQPPV